MSVSLQEQQAAKGLEELRELLLAEDRESQALLMERFAEMEAALGDDKAFATRLTPYLEGQVEMMQKNFPKLFGKFMGPAIKRQIEEERDVIIDALYPIIGKIIGRYLKEEIRRISEGLDKRLKDPFSWSTIQLRFKSWFSGISYEELLFREMASRQRLEEVFVIQKDTGLAMGHYALHEVTRSQMVAGMLTGIKNFLEDAFQKNGQELDTLEYEDYHIKIFSFSHFYIATVIEGAPDVEYARFLRTHVEVFCAEHPISADESVTQVLQDRLSHALQSHFDGFNQSRNQ